MLFWLIVVGVVAFSWGFAAGAMHEQYKPRRKIGQTFFGKGGEWRYHVPPVPMPPPPQRKAVDRIEQKLDVIIQQTRKTEWCGGPL